MCESTVYLMKGSEKLLVMEQAARIILAGKDIVCIDTMGERKTVRDAKFVEANLIKHEFVVKPI